jgi:hypothetical protein
MRLEAPLRTRATGRGRRARSWEQVRIALIGRLRERVGEIEEAIMASILGGTRKISGGDDAEYLAGLRAAVAAAVDYGLSGLTGSGEWSGTIPPAVIIQSQRAARLGVGLDAVLRRYIAGHTVMGDFVMQEADHPDVRGYKVAVRHLLSTQAALLDDLITAVTTEYLSEMERAGCSPEQRRAARVRRLLAGGPPDSTGLDYALDAWHVGMIATGHGAGEAAEGICRGLGRPALVVPYGEETTWIWLGRVYRTDVAKIGRLVSQKGFPSASLAIGEPARGLDGWRLTHRQAQAALVVALRRRCPLVRFADVALVALLLRDPPLARSLVDIYLSPLDGQRDGGAISRETLRAYFAAGGVAASAAATLEVDRHTVENRLRAVERKLGRLLPECHSELEVALQLEELGDGASNGCGSPAEL